MFLVLHTFSAWVQHGHRIWVPEIAGTTSDFLRNAKTMLKTCAQRDFSVCLNSLLVCIEGGIFTRGRKCNSLLSPFTVWYVWQYWSTIHYGFLSYYSTVVYYWMENVLYWRTRFSTEYSTVHNTPSDFYLVQYKYSGLWTLEYKYYVSYHTYSSKQWYTYSVLRMQMHRAFGWKNENSVWRMTHITYMYENCR